MRTGVGRQASGNRRQASKDSTPAATRHLLILTVVVTVIALTHFLATRSTPAGSRHAAIYLTLFTALFLARVAGQIAVRLWRPSWLPPTGEWNLSPYVILLPTQLLMLWGMTALDAGFWRADPWWTTRRPDLGSWVFGLALIYAAVMLARYVVRMTHRPDQRWFGGAIPIFFHWVLASYLIVWSVFHVGW